MPDISLHRVSASIGDTTLLRDVTFSVQSGGAIAVLGASGAGKSSLLRTIAGVQSAASGTVCFDGADLTRHPAERVVQAGVSLVPQGRPIIPDMSVEENLQLGGYAKARSIRALAALVDAVLDLFPALRPHRAQPAGSLPTAEQQLLAIGRGLMSQPRLLMIDELSSGLPKDALSEIIEAIAELRIELGMTLIFAERDISTVKDSVESAIVLDRGAITMRVGPADLQTAQHLSLAVPRAATGMPPP